MWKLIKAFLCLGMGVSYGEDDEAEAKRTAKVREMQAAERLRQQRILEEDQHEVDPEWAKRPGRPGQ